MKKLALLSLLSLLTVNFQTLGVMASISDITPGVYSQQAQEEAKSEEEILGENSFYISDEQLEAAAEEDSIEDLTQKVPFDTRVINSSHFSSGTPSKTYQPLNK